MLCAGLFRQQLHAAQQCTWLLLCPQGPLRARGLAPLQRLLLAGPLAARWMALPVLLLAVVPLVLVLAGVAPVASRHLWELLAAFTPMTVAGLALVSAGVSPPTAHHQQLSNLVLLGAACAC